MSNPHTVRGKYLVRPSEAVSSFKQNSNKKHFIWDTLGLRKPPLEVSVSLHTLQEIQNQREKETSKYRNRFFLLISQVLPPPQLNHNTTQPNIAQIWFDMKMTLHSTATHQGVPIWVPPHQRVVPPPSQKF